MQLLLTVDECENLIHTERGPTYDRKTLSGLQRGGLTVKTGDLQQRSLRDWGYMIPVQIVIPSYNTRSRKGWAKQDASVLPGGVMLLCWYHESCQYFSRFLSQGPQSCCWWGLFYHIPSSLRMIYGVPGISLTGTIRYFGTCRGNRNGTLCFRSEWCLFQVWYDMA